MNLLLTDNDSIVFFGNDGAIGIETKLFEVKTRLVLRCATVKHDGAVLIHEHAINHFRHSTIGVRRVGTVGHTKAKRDCHPC